jgi:hypothetical protein
MGVQKHYKKRFTKKVVSKSFYKKFDQKSKSKTDFFSNFFNHVFGRFSMRGVQKHDKKNVKKINPTPVLFRTLTHPPTTGVTDFGFSFLPAPWHVGPSACAYATAPATERTHFLYTDTAREHLSAVTANNVYRGNTLP